VHSLSESPQKGSSLQLTMLARCGIHDPRCTIHDSGLKTVLLGITDSQIIRYNRHFLCYRGLAVIFLFPRCLARHLDYLPHHQLQLSCSFFSFRRSHPSSSTIAALNTG
jgi:hypothetical protein